MEEELCRQIEVDQMQLERCQGKIGHEAASGTGQPAVQHEIGAARSQYDTIHEPWHSRKAAGTHSRH